MTPADPLPTAEALAAIDRIKVLKARYFRLMDTKDWDGWGRLFTPDAEMDTSGEAGGRCVRGRDGIVAYVRGAVDPVTTVHHGHMPEITLTSPTTATGIWAMEDMLRFPEGMGIGSMHGYGHYHETYELHDGEWLIASTKLTRLRIDVS